MKFRCLENEGNQTRDVVIVTVPWTDSSIPLMAPAVLAPIVEKAGMTCLATDVNAEVFNWSKQHQHRDELVKFFFDEITDKCVYKDLFDLFYSMATQILRWSPKIVGLSLFSYVSQKSAKWLAYFIKKISPKTIIVVGGAGCLNAFTGPSDFIEDLISKKIIDYHIRGDGEHSLYEFLMGNKQYHGINSIDWKELSKEELRSLPTPDYKNYHFDLYSKKAMPIIGSRGCVRKCTFCDYIANWKNFQWRTAEDIFSEMLYQFNKYGIRFFKFQDSLTNGNQKEFVQLTKLLSDYNKKNPDKSFKWNGYFIFREVSKSSANEWKLLSESGAESLAVGIENLNQHIRYDIGKKFSNKAIDFHLQQAKKYNIKLQLLNIVGYINETEKDIDFIKQWLVEHVNFKDILFIQWGGTLGVFPNTYLEKHFDKLGLIKVANYPQGWVNPDIGSTPTKRARWAKELVELSKNLGYEVADNLDNHYVLELLINDKF